MTGPSPLDGFDLSSGYFYAPTALTFPSPSSSSSAPSLWHEELFSPVILLRRFDGSEDEAVELANDCEYGLGAGVWTADAAKGMRVAERVEAGICWGAQPGLFRRFGEERLD